MVGIVNSPQFDIQVFKPGTAVRVISKLSSDNRWWRFNKNCLVLNSTPLVLRLTYIDTDDDEQNIDNIDLPIEYVATENVTVDILSNIFIPVTS